MIALRAGTVDDVEAVLAFWSVATTEPSSTDDAGALHALLAHAPDALLLAVETGESPADEVVGTVIAGWDGWRGTIYRLAVAPAHRRQGIATQLVAAAEASLRARGTRRMHLIVGMGTVGAHADTAEAFWRSAGYLPTGQLRMVKDLERPARDER